MRRRCVGTDRHGNPCDHHVMLMVVADGHTVAYACSSYHLPAPLPGDEAMRSTLTDIDLYPYRERN